MATVTERIRGINSGLGVKAPCRVATTTNITLEGEQTIDGVSVVSGDRVLVKNQTNAINNGIYKASTSMWIRAEDFDGIGDAVQGTLIPVAQGIISEGVIYEVSTASFTIGTNSVEFSATASTDIGNYITEIQGVYDNLGVITTAVSDAQAAASSASADAIQTASDRVQTGLDVTATAQAVIDAEAARDLAQGYATSANVDKIEWKGNWVTATTYDVRDAVYQGGSSYICNTTHTSGVFATDLSKWDIMALKGTDGAGAGDMLKSENLSGLANYTTARSNLGLGSLAVLSTVGASEISTGAISVDELNKTSITSQTSATIASGDSIVFSDVSDSGDLKKTLMSAVNINALGSGTATVGQVPQADGSGAIAWATVASGGGYITTDTIAQATNWDTVIADGISKTTGTYTYTEGCPLMGLAHEGILIRYRIAGDSNRVVQRWIEASTGEEWQRATANGGTTWNMWVKTIEKYAPYRTQRLWFAGKQDAGFVGTTTNQKLGGLTTGIGGTGADVQVASSAYSASTGYTSSSTAVRLGTGTTTTGNAGLVDSDAVFGQINPNTSTGYGRMEIKCAVSSLSDGTNRYNLFFGTMWTGRTETNTISFSYTDNENSGNWVCITDSGGTETVTNTSNTVAVDSLVSNQLNPATVTKLRIELENNTKVRFYINDVLVATHTTNINTNAMFGYVPLMIRKTAGSTVRYAAACDYIYQMFR